MLFPLPARSPLIPARTPTKPRHTLLRHSLRPPQQARDLHVSSCGDDFPSIATYRPSPSLRCRASCPITGSSTTASWCRPLPHQIGHSRLSPTVLCAAHARPHPGLSLSGTGACVEPTEAVRRAHLDSTSALARRRPLRDRRRQPPRGRQTSAAFSWLCPDASAVSPRPILSSWS